jgi:hypothetical protein
MSNVWHPRRASRNRNCLPDRASRSRNCLPDLSNQLALSRSIVVVINHHMSPGALAAPPIAVGISIGICMHQPVLDASQRLLHTL